MSSQVISPETVEAQNKLLLAEKGAQSVIREPNGKFVAGHTKPGPGRPKTVRIKEAFEHILQTEGADKYARVVANIALKGKRQADKLAAVRDIRDTVEGRPVQAMLVGHTLDQTSITLIAEILGKLNVPPALESGDE